MIKIRITGLPDEIERFLTEIRKRFSVLSESKTFKNSNSNFSRKYVDVQEDKDQDLREAVGTNDINKICDRTSNDARKAWWKHCEKKENDSNE